MRFYFDTSIWLDFYENRGINGEKTNKLIEKIINDNSIILYSDQIIIELKKLDYTKEEIFELFYLVKHFLKKVYPTKENLIEARNIAYKRDLPKKDVIHAILSRDNEAQLISRDRHFEKLKDITITKATEDFII